MDTQHYMLYAALNQAPSIPSGLLFKRLVALRQHAVLRLFHRGSWCSSSSHLELTPLRYCPVSESGLTEKKTHFRQSLLIMILEENR